MPAGSPQKRFDLPLFWLASNGSIWLSCKERYSQFLVYRSTVPTPSWVRRKRAWFIKKKSGFAVWNFLGTRKNPTSGAFWLRLFAQYSTVIRAVFSTSTTNFFYVPTRTLRHLHLRFFFNNFYVTELRTSKPPIGPYFFQLGLGLGLGLGLELGLGLGLGVFQNTRISMDRDSRGVLLHL